MRWPRRCFVTAAGSRSVNVLTVCSGGVGFEAGCSHLFPEVQQKVTLSVWMVDHGGSLSL